ncbi:hypothetical protein HMI54_001926 [Coelomomyces lativittatus]|nr:hypothetical protein HMI54_001926 [Coelomomyces lativittatus]KAJ1510218.1 hypothetical protein HMI56_006441 [Coelomomyces lativittatus]KAJ1512555.1 hypothetical protein HMI55_006190 [Coelomomyces lativittatus]
MEETHPNSTTSSKMTTLENVNTDTKASSSSSSVTPSTPTSEMNFVSPTPPFLSRTQQKLLLQKDRWQSEMETPTSQTEHLKLVKEIEKIHKEFQALIRLDEKPVQKALNQIFGPQKQTALPS